MPVKISDFGDRLLSEASARVIDRLKLIGRTQDLISSGKGLYAESKERLHLFCTRQKALIEDEFGCEKQIGKIDDKLSIEFLEAGLLASKSVGRLNVLYGDSFGTAFHVGSQIIITNHHVLNDPQLAATCAFELNVEENRLGEAKRIYSYSLDPDRFFLKNEDLDFTMVAVSDPSDDTPPISDFGWHALMKVQGKIRVGDPVNIIQHPGGGHKAVVVHNSHFLHLEDDTRDEHFCWYSGDTEEGSSGSPVFNNRWEVVALHHKSVPKTNKNGVIVDRNGRVMSKNRLEENPEEIAWAANEGIRASRIVTAIERANLVGQQQHVRDELLELWSAPGAHRRGQKAGENSP